MDINDLKQINNKVIRLQIEIQRLIDEQSTYFVCNDLIYQGYPDHHYKADFIGDLQGCCNYTGRDIKTMKKNGTGKRT